MALPLNSGAPRRGFLQAGAVGLVAALLLSVAVFVVAAYLRGLALLGEERLGTPWGALLFLLALGLLAVMELPLVLWVLVRLARQGVAGPTLNALHFGYVLFPALYGALGALLTGERWWLAVMALLAGARLVTSAAAIHPEQMAARTASPPAPNATPVRARPAASTVLGRVRGFVLDMDGVLYRGSTVREGTLPFITFLNEQGIPYVCLTNNASRTSEMYQAKLGSVGHPH